MSRSDPFTFSTKEKLHIAGTLGYYGGKYVYNKAKKHFGYKSAAVVGGAYFLKNKLMAPPKRKRGNTGPPTPSKIPARSMIQYVSAPQKSSKSRHTQTKGMKKSSGFGYTGASSSKSLGFLKKGSRKKSFRKKPLMKYAQNGVNFTQEGWRTITGVDAVWIGHATYPRNQIFRQVVQSMFYHFLVRSEKIRESTTVDTNISSLPQNSTIRIVWRPAAGATAQNENFLVPVAGVTIRSFTDWFLDIGRPWIGSVSVGQSVQYNYEGEFQEIAVHPTTASMCSMMLNDLICNVYIKSSLKIQNRSKTGTGDVNDETDVVDSVPLYGKSYSGNGTSLRSKNAFGLTGQDMDLVSDQQYGIIIGNESLPGRKEPAQPRDFINVKNCGKVHIDPGQLKTSVLTQSFKHYFNTFFKQSSQTRNPEPDTVAQVAPVGNKKVNPAIQILEYDQIADTCTLRETSNWI